MSTSTSNSSGNVQQGVTSISNSNVTVSNSEFEQSAIMKRLAHRKAMKMNALSASYPA